MGELLNCGWTFELWVKFLIMGEFWIMGEIFKYGWTFWIIGEIFKCGETF